MISTIIGHLVGDFLLQDDWMAKNKKISTYACLIHVMLYTVAVWLFSGWPGWTVPLIAVPHFLIDRWSFVRKWMYVMNQDEFADRLGPWSVIAVDQSIHLVCLWAVWQLVIAAGGQ